MCKSRNVLYVSALIFFAKSSVCAQADTVNLLLDVISCQNDSLFCAPPSAVGVKKGAIYLSPRRKLDFEAGERYDSIKGGEDYVVFYCNSLFSMKKIQQGYYYEEGTNGFYQYFYKNGCVKSKGVYYESEKTGLWKYYDKKGNLIKEEYFDYKTELLGTEPLYPKLVRELKEPAK